LNIILYNEGKYEKEFYYEVKGSFESEFDHISEYIDNILMDHLHEEVQLYFDPHPGEADLAMHLAQAYGAKLKNNS